MCFESVIDNKGTQYSLMPLLECKEAYEYTILSFSIIMVDIQRICYQVFLDDGSAIIVDRFILNTDKLTIQVFPT